MNSCVIVNRNYPPTSGITGSSANELAFFLISNGIDVNVVSVDGKYSGGGLKNNCISGNVYRIRSFYNGKNKLFRLLSSLIEGFFLARKAVSLYPACIICLTDPPLLNLWVSYYSKKSSTPWIYWSMDLYPDAFIAANLVSSKNLIYRLLESFLCQNPPVGLISLGRHQIDYISKSFGEISKKVILPCGIRDLSENNSIPNWKQNNDKIIIGYVGNIGEAHDAKFIISIIDSFNPSKQLLILSVYGARADFVLKHASGKIGVLLLPQVSQSELRFIDLHIVSLLPCWDNICVPSKAFTAVSLGCCLILNCSNENDIYAELFDASWHFEYGNYSDLKFFFKSISKSEINSKRKEALHLSKNLADVKNKAFSEILHLTKSISFR